MAVREQGDVSLGGANSGDNTVGPRAHLFPCLAARGAVSENRPIGPRQADMFCLEPLLFAIVPFD